MLSISVSSFYGANTLVFNVSEGLDKFYCRNLRHMKVVLRDERAAAMWMVSEGLDKFHTDKLSEEKQLNF